MIVKGKDFLRGYGILPNSPEPPKEFCVLCGKEMEIVIKQKLVGSRFDSHTGEGRDPSLVAYYSCPSSFLLGHRHYNYLLDSTNQWHYYTGW